MTAADASVLIVGGTGALGRAVAADQIALGRSVIVTSREPDRGRQTAAELGGDVQGHAVDLSKPASITSALASVGKLRGLVITAADAELQPLADPTSHTG